MLVESSCVFARKILVNGLVGPMVLSLAVKFLVRLVNLFIQITTMEMPENHCDYY